MLLSIFLDIYFSCVHCSQMQALRASTVVLTFLLVFSYILFLMSPALVALFLYALSLCLSSFSSLQEFFF